MAADHLRPLGIPYDAEVAAKVAVAGEALNEVRGNLALLLHDEGVDADDVVAYAERWGLLPRARAEKAVQFQTDPTWRAYIFCYLEGLPPLPVLHRRRPGQLRAPAHRAAAPERPGRLTPGLARGAAGCKRQRHASRG